MKSRAAQSVLVAAMLVGASVASAHPLDIGYLDVEVHTDGKVAVRIELPTAAQVVSAGQLLTSLLLRANGAACGPPADVHGNRALAITLVDCPAADSLALTISLPALAGAPTGFQLIGRATLVGDEQVFTLDVDHPSALVAWDHAASISRFITMGVRHIGAWPSEWITDGHLHFPAGIDHLLFLFALLLGGANLKRTLATVTGFTVGHSVTLALATLGIAHAPSRVVEPAIALSIIYVALEDLWRAAPQHRWQVATFFGLVHGLAFAAALTELHLQRADMARALVGFNVGVELGQAGIVVLLSMVLYTVDKLARPSARVRRRAVQLSAVAIIIPATYWFVQRAFF